MVYVYILLINLKLKYNKTYMFEHLLTFFISFLFLLSLNKLFKKFNFNIDKTSIYEEHKLLLQFNNNVPLSGSFYFLTIIIIIEYFYSLNFIYICLCFFIIGILSDIKVTHSPKLRLLLQSFSLIIFLYFNKDFIIDLRVDYLNSILESEIFRIIFISFFFLVLINGYNFIDGVNSLCSLNFLIVFYFFLLVAKDINYLQLEKLIFVLILCLTIFVIFNFYGKTFLGDGGVYGLACLIGIIAVYLSNKSDTVSPYFIANLFWYPAFENLFSIIRRIISNKKNYLADNLHLHQLLFIYLKKKNNINKKYLLSSLSGLIINTYLLIFFVIGFQDYSDTKLQIYLILTNTFFYLLIYHYLKKFND